MKKKIDHPKFDSLEKFNCIKQVRIVPQAKTKSKNQYFTIEIVRSLFEEEKANVLNLIEKNKANKAIARQIITSPQLDENGNPIIKMFEATKRGRKLKDGNGNKIIGKNKEWKKEINLGNCNNQNFVQMPLAQLLDKILYKVNKAGIHVIFTEESYTSKTSFFDKEELKSFLSFYDTETIKMQKEQTGFIGQRIKRGLFKSPNRKSLFHADVNAAFNIMRKVLGDYVYQLINVTSLSHSGAEEKKEFKLFR